MIIINELKLISEASSFEEISKLISKYENATADIDVAKELLESALKKQNEILTEDVVYYPQDNSKNTFVIDASPEINKNFGSDKIGYFKLFDLRITPTINYLSSQCWRINILSPTYEMHYNSIKEKLNSKDKKKLIEILSSPYLDQYTKKQINNNYIDKDYQDIYNTLKSEYIEKNIPIDENKIIVYNWNALLYKVNKVNNLVSKKSAFPLLTEMPNYNLLQ